MQGQHRTNTPARSWRPAWKRRYMYRPRRSRPVATRRATRCRGSCPPVALKANNKLQYVYKDGESKDGGVVRDGSVPPSVGEDDPPSQPSPPPHVGQARRRDWRPTCSFLACIRQSCIGIHTFIVFIKARRRVRRDCIQNRIDPG